MTAERYRMPLLQGAAAAGYGHHGHASTDLFGADPAQPHPAFLQRLELFRRYGVEGLQRVAQQPMTRSVVHRAPTAHRPRHARPEPAESRQYAGDMSTTAARDDRLTPNAKALLQVIRARCGKGRSTTITKGTIGNVMARSTRTIRRYLVDLVRFGYLEVEIQRNARGLHLGLAVTITEKVLPFFEEAKGLARWLAETPAAVFRPFEAVLSGNPGVTNRTSKNQARKNPLQNTVTSRRAARGRASREERVETRSPT